MPFTVTLDEEFLNSRQIQITNQSFSERFVFYMCGDFYENAQPIPPYGRNDDVVVLQAAYSILPLYFIMPMLFGGYAVLVIDSLDITQVADDTWKAEVMYKQPEFGQGSGGAQVDAEAFGPQVGDTHRWTDEYVQIGFNVAAEQQTITMSDSLIARNSPWELAPVAIYELDKGAPIGQTAESVEGVDVYARQFSFNVTCYKRPEQVSFRYTRKLYRMSTTINDRLFFGFPPGSVLFLEAQAQGNIFSTIPVTMEFKVRPNFKFTRTGVSIPMPYDTDDPTLMFDTISDPFFQDNNSYSNNYWKNIDGSSFFESNIGDIFSGWDVVDYRYDDGVIDASGFVIKKPIWRLIHRVYGYSNFNDLEINHFPVPR
jgi:hypothetical protein